MREARPPEDAGPSASTIPRSTSKSGVLSSGIVIALATAAVYAMALLYQSGRADYFGLPLWFVSFEIGTVASSVFKVFEGLLPYLMMAVWFGLVIPWDVPAWRRVGWYSIAGVVILAQARWDEATVSGLVIIIPLAAGYLLGSLARSFAPRLDKEQPTQRPLRGSLSEKVGMLPFWAKAFGSLVLVSMFVTCSYSSGEASAREQVSYWILQSSPDRVVLSSSESTMVLATFDPEGNALTGDYQILDLRAAGEVGVCRRDIGPLEPLGGRPSDARKHSVWDDALGMMSFIVGWELSAAWHVRLPRGKTGDKANTTATAQTNLTGQRNG